MRDNHSDRAQRFIEVGAEQTLELGLDANAPKNEHHVTVLADDRFESSATAFASIREPLALRSFVVGAYLLALPRNGPVN